MAEGADSRTEAATPRRLQRAREEGQVALSREAAPVAVLAAASLMLALRAPQAADQLARAMADVLAHSDSLTPDAAARTLAAAAIRTVLPFPLAAVLAASGAVLGQTGLLIRLHALAPSFAKLNPVHNLTRLAGPAALMETGRSLLKLGLIGAAIWQSVSGLEPWLYQSLFWEPGLVPDRIARLLLRVLLAGVAVQGALALLDIVRARWSHARAMRMSRQEIREEMREADGDPQIKARIRRIRLTRARRRMLAAVRKATVVVTNPTHYAVALAYERGTQGAPRVVAKGVDAMAARIREIAEEARVPLVTNPPLARTLWQVELDSEIPAALFRTVAEIIAYVWRLRTPRRTQR